MMLQTQNILDMRARRTLPWHLVGVEEKSNLPRPQPIAGVLLGREAPWSVISFLGQTKLFPQDQEVVSA